MQAAVAAAAAVHLQPLAVLRLRPPRLRRRLKRRRRRSPMRCG
jgi:hypothetical protein